MSYFSIPKVGQLIEIGLDGSAVDTSGNALSVTATNVTYETSPVSYKKQRGAFNGASSSVAGGSVTLGANFTIRCRVNKSNSSDQSYFTFGSYPTGGPLLFYSAGNLVYRGSGSTGDLTYGSFPTGESLVVVKQVGTTATIYVNGVQVAQGTVNSGAGTWSTNLGTLYPLGIYYLNGSVDVTAWNYALTDSELLNLWHEFNRKLAGGSDFGAFVPAPQFQIEYDGTWRDVSNAVNASSDSSVSTTDNFSISAKAASFNGSNQRVQFDDSGNYFDFTGPFSIEWFGKIASLPTSGNLASIFSKYDQGANAGGYECQLYNNAGTQQVFFGVSNGSSGGYPGGNYTLPTGTPCHLVFTHDNSTSRIYLDGVEILNGANARTVAANSKLFNLMNFGYYTPSSGELGRYLAGDVYAMRGFASCLTAAQAKFLAGTVRTRYPYAFRRSIPQNLQNGLLFAASNFDGTNLRDWSGNGNGGTVTHGTYVPGRLGQNVTRYQSSAATQNLSLGTDADFKPTSVFSFAVTINPTSTSYSSSPRIFSNEGGTQGGICIALGRTSATDMYPWVRLNYNNASTPTTTRAIPTNKPTRYGVTYDGATVKIFLNGKLDASVAYAASIAYDAGIETFLSRGRNTNGLIGHQGAEMFWNRALTDEEMQQDFHSVFA